jgi:LysM repeat protein
MKKEVQALINRDRDRDRSRTRSLRIPPVGLAAVAGVLGLLLCGGVITFFVAGPGKTLFQTPTPTPTLTPTPIPATPTPEFTDTPLFTETPTQTPGPPQPITYTVKEGDTLFSIAQQFNIDLVSLMTFNNITDASLLSVSSVLTIPVGAVELPTATSIPTGLPRGTRIKYVVQPGDTLQTIAARFNSTAEDIATTNKITDPNSIQVGQVLDVRVNIATPTPTPINTRVPATTTPTVTA